MTDIDSGQQADAIRGIERVLEGTWDGSWADGLRDVDTGRSAAPDIHSSGPDYASRFSGAIGEYLLEVQSKALIELMAPFKGASVLDVGGGHGQAAGVLLDAGHDVTVLASTEAAFGQARRFQDRAEFVTGRLDDLPFPPERFDVVVSLRMMPHVEVWQRFVAGLTRVAREAVIVDFPIPGGSNALEPLLFGAKKRLEGNTRRFTKIAKPDARAAFAANGFEADAEIGQFVFPMAVHRALKRPALSRCLEASVSGLAGRIGTPVLMRGRRR